MKLFRDGSIVEDILGAQTESVLRSTLERYIERDSDRIRKEALALAASGDTPHALEILHGAAADDPDNTRIILDLARLHVTQGNLTEARSAIEALPRDLRDESEARRINALINIAESIEPNLSGDELRQRIENNGDDMQARLQLAGRYALAEQYEHAMDQYLEIIRRDRNFNEGAGRKGMLAIFELLGNEGELISRYRRQMSSLLL
jgi:putative thioredoxin